MKRCGAKRHYDLLIEENNDPVFDPPELKAYMDGWDGERFLCSLGDLRGKSVLEIGVGTGRLAVRVCPLCEKFSGIDLSPNTVLRAKKNLSAFSDAKIFCGNFFSYPFSEKFDVIYSSLVLLHFKRKRAALKKAKKLLKNDGIFAISLDKCRNRYIDCGTRKVRVYPDDPKKIEKTLAALGFVLSDSYETERAFIIIAKKPE